MLLELTEIDCLVKLCRFQKNFKESQMSNCEFVQKKSKLLAMIIRNDGKEIVYKK